MKEPRLRLNHGLSCLSEFGPHPSVCGVVTEAVIDEETWIQDGSIVTFIRSRHTERLNRTESEFLSEKFINKRDDQRLFGNSLTCSRNKLHSQEFQAPKQLLTTKSDKM